MFMLYETYETQEGNKVMIVEESLVGTQHHCVKGDDGIWRYARKSDAGRVTGSAFDMSDPRNLKVPDEYACKPQPKDPFEGYTIFSIETK